MVVGIVGLRLTIETDGRREQLHPTSSGSQSNDELLSSREIETIDELFPLPASQRSIPVPNPHDHQTATDHISVIEERRIRIAIGSRRSRLSHHRDITGHRSYSRDSRLSPSLLHETTWKIESIVEGHVAGVVLSNERLRHNAHRYLPSTFERRPFNPYAALSVDAHPLLLSDAVHVYSGAAAVSRVP